MYNLIQGDCLQEMDKLIASGIKVDMVLTDPPYGTTRCKWDSVIPLEEMWNKIYSLINVGSAICLFGSEPFSTTLRYSNLDKFCYDWIWDKKFAGNFVQAKRQPLKTHEIVSVFSFDGTMPKYFPQMIDREAPIKKGGNKQSEAIPISITKTSKAFGEQKKEYNQKFPDSQLHYSGRDGRGLHPTQKPVDLLEYLIKTHTKEGETVLDFTMGSGSTGVACLNTNRNFIGIELDDKYYNVAKNRLQEAER